MNKSTIVTVILGIVVVVVASFALKPIVNVQIPTSKTELGANAGPDSFSECVSQNGLTRCMNRKPFNTATTTVCAIKSPSSTSTLVYAGAQVTTPTSTATTLRIATSTTPFSTTTTMNYYSVASGALGSFALTGTSSDAYLIAAPNTYLVFGAEGFLAADATKFNGQCSAVWNVL